MHSKLLEKYLNKFSPVYQNKVLRFLRWEDAQLSLLGRILLIQGMNDIGKKFNDYQLHYTKYHKPFFIESDLKFNISHSGNMAVCAISDEFEIGIDVELMNEIVVKSFKTHMTSYEWKKINDEEDEICAFYKYWTNKEAVVKAYGKGLSLPLKSFEIINGKVSIKNSSFLVEEIVLHKDYKCSLALMSNKYQDINKLNFDKNKLHIKQMFFKP
ncbi:4'-phosphopantetheinyl transferase family protein [Gaetbulibacter jejuensis]|uniref:4'-phosphopantetheinyl transferase family protein n=1 Tax=Gaetbulibacter jejuensis TaxID=584607 RepID=UPI0031E2ED51